MTIEVITLERFEVTASGRPAPQGSKRHGNAGQLREASVYLPAWRAAVKRAIYAQYQALGIPPERLDHGAMFIGPVAFGATFMLPAGRRADAPPDLDKLLRAVWDACTAARLWEDDGRVVEVDWLSKVECADGETSGVTFAVRRAGEWKGGGYDLAE